MPGERQGLSTRALGPFSLHWARRAELIRGVALHPRPASTRRRDLAVRRELAGTAPYKYDKLIRLNDSMTFERSPALDRRASEITLECVLNALGCKNSRAYRRR